MTRSSAPTWLALVATRSPLKATPLSWPSMTLQMQWPGACEYWVPQPPCPVTNCVAGVQVVLASCPGAPEGIGMPTASWPVLIALQQARTLWVLVDQCALAAFCLVLHARTRACLSPACPKVPLSRLVLCSMMTGSVSFSSDCMDLLACAARPRVWRMCSPAGAYVRPERTALRFALLRNCSSHCHAAVQQGSRPS